MRTKRKLGTTWGLRSIKVLFQYAPLTTFSKKTVLNDINTVYFSSSGLVTFRWTKYLSSNSDDNPISTIFLRVDISARWFYVRPSLCVHPWILRNTFPYAAVIMSSVSPREASLCQRISGTLVGTYLFSRALSKISCALKWFLGNNLILLVKLNRRFSC